MRSLERRVRALEQQQNRQPVVALINEGDPVPEGVDIVIVDDIPRLVAERQI